MLNFALLLCSSLTVIGSLLTLTATCFFDWHWPIWALGVGTLLVTLVNPRFSLLALIAALPIFGNRPGSIQLLLLTSICSGLILGLAIRQLLQRKADPSAYDSLQAYPIFSACLYGLVSLLSLSSLPFTLVIKELKTFIDYSSVQTFFSSLNYFLLSGEQQVAYSLLSVFLTFQALYLMYAFYTQASSNKNFALMTAGAVLFSLVHSLLIGLADYYQLFNLSALRPLDPIVNPDQIQFRLQSWFAHSGWFAEFVTLTIPFSMLALLLPVRFAWRVALIISLLLVGELVLILSYQRGGWLSYPLTLVAVWAAIYVVYCIEQKKLDILSALKHSFLKVVISLPITILLSLSLIHFFNIGTGGNFNSYWERFKGLGRTSDRTDFIVSGYLIGLRHPLLGAGSESYAYRFEQEFEHPAGAHYKQYELPLHGSAHNVYAQTFSGKGLVGLIFLLAIFVSLIFQARFIIYELRLTTPQRLLTLTGAAFAVAFLIYGNVQEIFYIQSLQILVFAIVGLTAAQVPTDTLKVSGVVRRNSATALLILFVLHLAWEFILNDRSAKFKNFYKNIGCYATEYPKEDQQAFSWCRKRAYLDLEVIELMPSKFFVELSLTLPAVYQQEVSMHIHSKFFDTQEITLSPGEQKELTIELRNNPAEFFIPVEIISNANFLPGVVWPGNSDLRPLSFQLMATPDQL